MSRQELLASVPLFESLTEDDLATLTNRFEEEAVGAGEPVFRQGDDGSSLYIIEDGEVEISYGSGHAKVVLATLFPGQYFGELSLFDGAPRSATATAMKPSRLIRLDRDDLVEFIHRNPAAALRIIAEMGERLRQTNELMSRQVSRNVLEEAEEKLTFGQRIADHVATFGGSWPFIILFGVVMTIWMMINVAGAAKFDPYPFILLNLVLSTLAGIQAPIIMMSQNRQAAKDRLAAALDYEVNLKSETEIASLNDKMDRLQAQIEQLMALQMAANSNDEKSLRAL